MHTVENHRQLPKQAPLELDDQPEYLFGMLLDDERSAVGQRNDSIGVELDVFDQVGIYKYLTIVQTGQFYHGENKRCPSLNIMGPRPLRKYRVIGQILDRQ